MTFFKFTSNFVFNKLEWRSFLRFYGEGMESPLHPLWRHQSGVVTSPIRSYFIDFQLHQHQHQHQNQHFMQNSIYQNKQSGFLLNASFADDCFYLAFLRWNFFLNLNVSDSMLISIVSEFFSNSCSKLITRRKFKCSANFFIFFVEMAIAKNIIPNHLGASNVNSSELN